MSDAVVYEQLDESAPADATAMPANAASGGPIGATAMPADATSGAPTGATAMPADATSGAPTGATAMPADATSGAPTGATAMPANAASGGPVGADPDLRRLSDVPLELSVEIGRTRMTVGETLQLRPGSIVTLERLAGEPVDLLVNGTPIARGEVVVVDEQFGLRVRELIEDDAAAGTLAAEPSAAARNERLDTVPDAAPQE